MGMIKLPPKFVPKARMFCVTTFSQEKVKGNEKRLQKQEWFHSFDEASKFYAT